MNTAIAKRNGSGHATDDLSIMSISDAFAKSGMFPQIRDAAQAFVKIMAGRELGFGPFASMKGVHVIQGNTALSASLIAARVKAYANGKYNYKVLRWDGEECSIEFYEDGKPCGPPSTFTLKDAQQAKIAGKDNWKNYPRNMLFARAMTNGARLYCADAFMGSVYTPEEMGVEVDGETGEVIDAPARVAVKGVKALEAEFAVVEQVKETFDARVVKVEPNEVEAALELPTLDTDADLYAELGNLAFDRDESEIIYNGYADKLKGEYERDIDNWRRMVLSRVRTNPQAHKARLATAKGK
jgi:hypothetical protein